MPSHETPPHGFANVSAPIAGVVGRPASTSPKSNAPSSPVAVGLDRPCRSLSRSCDGHARQARARPARPCPGVPPPGLKSRHTTPVIVARPGFGSDRLLRARRHVLGRDRRSARAARRSPGSQRRLEHDARSARARRALGVDGSASESEPGGVNASCDDRDDGVDRAAVRVLHVHDPPDHAGGERARSPSA